MHPKNIIILTLLLITLSTTPSMAQDCPPVKITDFPTADLPADLATAHLNGQESYKYYYGLGVPKDYAKARRLAFIEMQTSAGQDAVMEGSYILVMLYANGYGVKRNLDLAIRLACANVEGSGAEVDGRVQHLKDMQSKPSAEPFDICDDITSSYMEGFCASLQSEKAEQKRKETLHTLLKGWPPKDTTAYGSLRLAATNFFETQSDLEVDQSGTAHAAMQIEESETLEANFLEQIKKADQCTFEQYSQQDFEAADKKLNSVYSKLMHSQTDTIGTITKTGIRSTQRIWISYRDAWVTFTRTRCPSITETAIKTFLTKERTLQLESLLEIMD